MLLLLSLLHASLLPPRLSPGLASAIAQQSIPSASARAPPPAMAIKRATLERAAAGTFELTDRTGDVVRFCLSQEGSETPKLQLYVGDDLFSDGLERIAFDRGAGEIEVEDETSEGSMALCRETVGAEAATVALLVGRAGLEWEGDEPILLPDLVEEKLNVSEETKESRPGALLLWALLINIYPTEDEALAAVRRNSAIILPYLNRPVNIVGSWEVLLDLLGGEEEALQVVTRNPGVLACNPLLLERQNKEAILAASYAVNAVESVMWWK